MPRYTPQQLSAMATEAIQDRDASGHRYLQLVMTLCVMTGLSSQEVERKIEAMV